AVVVLVVLANDHLIMITAHFPLFFLKIRHFFYRYQLVDPKDPTYIGMITPNVLAEKLQKMTAPIASDQKCSTTGYNVTPDLQFCAGYFGSSVTTHDGDSGGPFIVYWHGAPVLIGLNKGRHGLYPGYHNDSWPDVYTNVSYFYPWIMSTMCENGGPC
ncbi:MAG: trypsin-like serine protease, partial [Enterobacteriaceae bacterium]